MSKVKICFMIVFLLMLGSCMTTTNGLVYKDGWKGRTVDEFIQHWERKGYRCGKREARTFDTGNLAGIGKCNKISSSFICPRIFSKSVSYDLNSNLIKGRLAEEISLSCF